MTNEDAEPDKTLPQKMGKSEWIRTLGMGSRYLAIRTLIVLLTVLAGIYAAIWVTNLGGYGDRQRRADIENETIMGVFRSGMLAGVPTAERSAILDRMVEAAIRASDLDQPFLIRSFRYFREALMLSDVLESLWPSLPLTLLLFIPANVLTFFGGLFIALALSQRYGKVVDRVTTLLVPMFAAPPWFHGIFLIVIFAAFAKLLPFGGYISPPIPETSFGYALGVLKHMILPMTAIVLGTMPHAVYANRALFLIHSSEDYVELAGAKGLKPNRIRIRYILRPVLPTIITNFIMVTLVAWQGIILTEAIFNWPGIGTLLISAIRMHRVSIVIGTVTVFAYLLGLSVLFLDLLYVMVDPRLKLGAGGRPL